MHSVNHQFACKLREIRGNLSYKQLQSQLEKDGQSSFAGELSRLERGENEPTTSLILDIYQLTHINPDRLLNDCNIDVVARFNAAFKRIERSSERLDEFIDACWGLSDPHIESLHEGEGDFISGVLYEGEAEETECPYAFRFKELRRYRGLSVNQVAELTGYNRSTVYRNEQFENDKMPQFRYLWAFCIALDVSADYLLFGELLGLPHSIHPILYGLSYSEQLELLGNLLEISKKYIGEA